MGSESIYGISWQVAISEPIYCGECLEFTRERCNISTNIVLCVLITEYHSGSFGLVQFLGRGLLFCTESKRRQLEACKSSITKVLEHISTSGRRVGI